MLMNETQLGSFPNNMSNIPFLANLTLSIEFIALKSISCVICVPEVSKVTLEIDVITLSSIPKLRKTRSPFSALVGSTKLSVSILPSTVAKVPAHELAVTTFSAE